MAKQGDFIVSEVRKTLITENKIQNIIVDKIGLPSVVAEWIMTEFNEKFQIFFANLFRDEVIKSIAGPQVFIAQHLRKNLKGDSTQASFIKTLLKHKGFFSGAFREIQEWLNNRRNIAPETDEINLKTLTFEEAKRRAETWHEEVRRLQAGRIEDESGIVIKSYPNGYYWIDLQRSSCRDEAKAMGHCGNATGNLFSLRKSKQPMLTGDVSRGSLVQLRGRANTKPKSEYHSYIMDFLMLPEANINKMHPSSYKPEQNFELKDLSLENLQTLYGSKPGLFVPEELYKVLIKYPEFINTVNLKLTNLWDEHKADLSRRSPILAQILGR
jgi:hypothetical protein